MERQIHKKNWLGTLIVLMLAMLTGTSARAQEVKNYGFTFCGEEVTSENSGKLSKIEGVSGKAWYVADNKTLYLENATIKKDVSIIENNSNPNLKIVLYGENNLTAQGVAIEIEAATTIYGRGSGTLNVKSEKSFGILTRKAPLNIEDCIMTVEGSSGIMGESGHKDEALTIRRSDVKAKGAGWGSIANIGKLVLESCAITSPDGAAYDETQKAVAKDGKTVGDIEISFTDYGFKVAGTYVTRENCQDLTVIEGVRTNGDGYAKYDPEMKTLTLKRATIESGAAIDNSGLDGLTIQVKGICRFDVKDNLAGMTVRRNTTILGAGRLDISGGDLGVFQEGGLLTAKQCILNISGKDYALYSSGGGGYSNLAVKCADVKFHGGKAAVFNYDSFSIDDCEIQSGEGNVLFDTEKKTFVDGGATANDVTIQSEVYGIRIDHEYVTKAIANDLNAISAVTGKNVWYSPVSNYIYLYDTTIESVDEAIANLSMNGLEIGLAGTNTLTTLEETPLYIGAQTTITGDEDQGGVLSIYSDDGNGIVMAADLKMMDCTVGAESGYGSAIKGVNGTEKLSLDFATAEATGTEGSICNIGELVIKNSDIVQPSGAAFDATLKGVALNGAIVTDKVVIETDYLGLSFCEEKVTKKNCDKLGEIEGVSGKVTYDRETKTLTLEDATIEKDKNIVNNYIDGLNMKLVGSNKMKTEEWQIESLNYEMKISGPGSLEAESSKYACIYVSGAPFTIEDCTINLKGGNGIDDVFVDYPYALIIRNANVTAECTNHAIGGLSSLTLEGCSITQPAGAAFDAELHGIALNGELVKKVVIEVDNTNSIENVQTDVSLRRPGIYTIEGMKMNGEWESLPTGMYIVDGVKMVKK